jgi:regulator of sigma E protease
MEVFLIKTLQFFMSISLLVLLHELGHFAFAKLFKVRVNRFYLFFNPKFHIASTYDTWVRRLFKMKPEVVPTKDVTVTDDDGKSKTVKEKEYVGTEYGLGWLPLGGYCAIDGMIDETNQKLSEETHPWEFRVKPTWQRLLIMVGGVLVNFLLALFIYSMVLYTWGETYVPVQNMSHGLEFNEQAKRLGFEDGDILLSSDKGEFKKFDADLFRLITDSKEITVMRNGNSKTIAIGEELSLLDMLKSEPPFARPRIPAVVDSVLPGTPAEKAGLRKGDLLTSINGHEVASFGQFTDQLAAIGELINEMPADSLKRRHVTITLMRDGTPDTISATLTAQLKLGFSPVSPYSPTTVEYGFLESLPAGVGYGWHVLASYVDDLKYVFTSDGAKSLGGFGTIGGLFPDTWDWHRFWLMTALLSIILAFMNILPIPALDGGHVLFLLYEMVTGRKPSDQFMMRAEYIGFGIVILLMVVANLNDILRWLGYM